MPDVRLDEIFEQGWDSGRGNLLGIQPFMVPDDYGDETAFFARLMGYFEAAAERGWLGSRTVVVLPEYLGTWLVVAGEAAAVFSARTVPAAMRLLVLRHIGRMIPAMLRSSARDRVTAGIFQVKAANMARIYQSIFSRLARQYGVTIVAGSILLPNPTVRDGQITPGCGPLYNTSFIFYSNGLVDPQPVRKVYPTADELPFVAPGRVEDLPVWDTPAGRLGVLICADAWYPAVYERLRAQSVSLLVVPSTASHGKTWEAPWRGYSGWPAPADVDPLDLSRLTEHQAWVKYGMAGRIAASGAAAGLNVFLYGDLWDLDFTSGQWRLSQGQTQIEGSCRGPALINLWLK